MACYSCGKKSNKSVKNPSYDKKTGVVYGTKDKIAKPFKRKK